MKTVQRLRGIVGVLLVTGSGHRTTGPGCHHRRRWRYYLLHFL